VYVCVCVCVCVYVCVCVCVCTSYAKIKPAALQVELHPYLTQTKLHRLCRQHGIALIGFSR
jgi:D-xylose reductase